MTQDPRAVAEKLIEQMGNYPGVSEHFRDEWRAYYKQDIDLIMHALTDARRQGMEEAAKIVEGLDAETYEFAGQTYDSGMLTLFAAAKAIRAQASQEGKP